ncbi:helix-turn-helix domain-containing protein [Kitasatospora sp. NPDC058032]|uniref:helix-turn-helix domain-containing protein n=1 Tax=Kitasatospora sp. NPDC058032 TaxID=3346307 RepID=UPI0036DEE27A
MARRKVEPGDRPRQWGDELAFWRKSAGLSQEELAQMVNMHQTRVSQFELGKAFPVRRDVELFDTAVGAGGQLVRSFELVAPYIRDYYPDWFEEFTRSELKARIVRELQAGRISGLFQTEDYMRTLFTAQVPNRTPDEIDTMVQRRVERQKRVIWSTAPPRVLVIQEQATLERTVGGPAVMFGQLQHLLTVMQLPHVTVQVLPFSATEVIRMQEMMMLDTIDGRRRVYSESINRGHFIDEEVEVDLWDAVYDRARAAALSVSESVDLISRIMRGLSNHVRGHRSVDRTLVQEQLLRGERRRLHRGGPRLPPHRPRP